MSASQVARRSEPGPDAATGGYPTRGRWLALALGMVAVALNALDFSLVTVAVPDLRRDLGVSDATVLVLSGLYSLTFVLTLLFGGRFGDVAGRRRVFLIGTAGFAIASALAGGAPNAATLAVARAAQGAFAALTIPQVLAMIGVAFPTPGSKRIAAFSPYGIVVPVTAPLAPALGSFLVTTDPTGLGWRSVFLLNAVLAMIVWAVSMALLPNWPTDRPPRMDVVGALLGGLAVLLLVYPLTAGRGMGWPPTVAVPLLLSVALAILLVRTRRRGRRADAPGVAVNLFTHRPFTVGMVAILLLAAAILGFFPLFAAYLQAGLGYSPVEATLVALPWAAGVIIGSAVACLAVPRIGRPVPLCGALLAAAGMVWLLTVFQDAGTVAGAALVLPLMVSGFGKGLIAPALIDRTLRDTPPRDIGSASGLLLAIQQVGGALGLAVVGTLTAAALTSHATGQQARYLAQLEPAVQAAALPPSSDATERVRTALRQCYQARVASLAAQPPTSRCPELDRHVDTGVLTGATAADLSAAVNTAVHDVNTDGYPPAIRRGLWSEVVLFAIAFALLSLLPWPAPRRHAETSA